ncbi:High mobility group superfamily, partial [Penicillium robsamsonii]|uniref:High mobility group superfamily n=1 Tax=Penicillium robsamsonii TaxID=1792511 RepID=UPI0025488BFF
RSSGGFLRTLQRDTLPRRTSVIDLQNQFGRVCLAANSGLARPQVQPISSIQSLFQSHSFATASTPPKAKSSKKADSEPKKKRVLSEKQQEVQNRKKHNTHIKELKATGLVQRPKRLPTSAYTLAVCEKLREIKGEYKQPEAFLVAIEHGKSISGSELERLQAQAKANIAANAAAFDAWVKTHTPLQIKEANTARLTLSRLGKKHYTPIKDDRQPKKPKSAYILYLADRIDTDSYQGKPGTETFTAIAEEWSRLPQSEKDRYHKLQVEDRERYEREHQRVYGQPAPKSSLYDSEDST